MKSFKRIHERAINRKGGKAELGALLPDVLSNEALASISNDRYLSEMSRCVFQAGFSWRVVEKKWPEFEEAFWCFEPQKMVMLSPQHLENLYQDTRIIRNAMKINTIPHNAQMIIDISKEHGSFGDFIANWPSNDLVGLFAYLKNHGSRLGGMTSQVFLRYIGKDGFMLTKDVVACLGSVGVQIADSPTSKRDLKAAQDTFNQWHEDTKLPYAHLSKIMACSVG